MGKVQKERDELELRRGGPGLLAASLRAEIPGKTIIVPGVPSHKGLSDEFLAKWKLLAGQ